MRSIALGVRSLRRAPVVAAAAIASIALGIGASTTMFAVVRQVLLEPLPYPAADRLVMLWETSPDDPARWVAPANFVDWRRDLGDVVETMAAFDSVSVSATSRGEAERLRAVSASGTFFATLGQGVVEGRPLVASDDRAGAPCVAVLSAGLRRRRFGDAPVVGTPLVLDERPCTVVGVLPSSFEFPLEARAEIWLNGDRGIPRSFPFPGDVTTVRDAHLIFVVARLREGIDVATADARLSGLAANLARTYPDSNSGLGARVQRLHDAVTGDVSRPLWLLQAAVLVLLLVACVNVAHLLMGRAASRRQELAVRVALGARRADLARQLLGEALAYAVPGGALGLLVATWSLEALVAAAPAGVPRLAGTTLDLRMVAVAVALTVGTALLVACAPMVWAGATPSDAVGAAGVRVSGTPSLRRWHRGLVIGELALAQVLMAGAWLLVSSLSTATHVPLGYATTNLVVAELSLRPDRYLRPANGGEFSADPVPRRQFLETVLTRLRATPGVTGAAAALTAPLSGAPNRGVRIVGQPEPAPGQGPQADFQVVTPDFVSTLGIRLVAGRLLAVTDDAAHPAVALVSDTFARRYLGTGSPVGRVIEFGGSRRHEIVGVVADTRYRRIEQPAEPAFYVPFAQNDEAWPYLAMVISTSAPASAMTALGAAVREADPAQPLSAVRTLDDIVGGALATRRFNTALVLLFGVVAMMMASVGAYGVMAAQAAARLHEFGIRAALGASGAALSAQVLTETIGLAAAAAALGAAGALAGAPLWQRLLFGVSARDPLALSAAAVTVALAALAAAWPAARRVGRTSPLEALRLVR